MAAAAATPPALPSLLLTTGMHVMAREHAAVIVDTKDSSALLHYIGWGSNHDEWVALNELTPVGRGSRRRSRTKGGRRKMTAKASAEDDMPALEKPPEGEPKSPINEFTPSKRDSKHRDAVKGIKLSPKASPARTRKRKISQNSSFSSPLQGKTQPTTAKSVKSSTTKRRSKKIKVDEKGKTKKNRKGIPPFSSFKMPSPEHCYFAHSVLCGLYGKPDRDNSSHRAFSLLDSLCRTILSQNTTDNTSARAFANLKKQFPTWLEVLNAGEGEAEEAIRCGGLADVKMERIRMILRSILSEFPQHCPGGEPSLNFINDWPTEKVKKYLLNFKGVGPKTVSCLLMFAMRRDEFPVDTHVWKIALRLGWVPKSANRETTYQHLNERIPNPINEAVIDFDEYDVRRQHGKVLRNALGELSVVAKAGAKLDPEAMAIADKAKEEVLGSNKKKYVYCGKDEEGRDTKKKIMTKTEQQMAFGAVIEA